MGILRALLFAAALPLAAQSILIDAAGPGDQYFSPAGTCAPGGTCRTTSAAMGDPPMNTQRFGYNGTAFQYAVPLPNGIYDLTLSFAEQSKTQPGQRVFTVTVQGEGSSPIDLVKLTGGPNFPYYQTWNAVPVRAGLLTIRFIPQIGNPVINAIEIKPVPALPISVDASGAVVIDADLYVTGGIGSGFGKNMPTTSMLNFDDGTFGPGATGSFPLGACALRLQAGWVVSVDCGPPPSAGTPQPQPGGVSLRISNARRLQ